MNEVSRNFTQYVLTFTNPKLEMAGDMESHLYQLMVEHDTEVPRQISLFKQPRRP